MKFRSLLALAILVWVSSCDRNAGTNDETTTSVARIYLPNGKPAAGARALLYPSGDTTQIPSGQAFVATDGALTLPVVSRGWYNLVVTDRNGRAVLIDSLLSTGGSPAITSDTLRNTATVVGQILVQPQHSAQIAWVQLAGAGVYANLDSVGRFRLSGIPAGKLTLAALTREAQYTNAFVSFRTFPDSTIDLGKISLPYTGLPIVQGILARYDSLEGVLHVSWNRVHAHGLKGYVIDGLPNISFTTDTTLSVRYFSPYDSGAQSDGWFDTTTRKVSFSVRTQDSSDALGAKWEQPSLALRSLYMSQRGKWTWTSLAKLPGPRFYTYPSRLDTAADHLVLWYPGDSSSTWNLWTSVDGLTWIQLWSNKKIVGEPAVANGSIWHLEGLDPTLTIKTFRKLALVRQNLDGGMVSTVTLTPSTSVPSGYITFRHDTAIVSPGVFDGTATTPCTDNAIEFGLAPVALESWILTPEGSFSMLAHRAFSAQASQRAKTSLRDLTDGIDWWINNKGSYGEDSCGYYWGMNMLGGASISLVASSGDTLIFQGPIVDRANASGPWVHNTPSNLYQDGIVMRWSSGLVRWRFDDPNHPWTTPYPFGPADNYNLAITPWKNGITSVSQDGQLWYATLSDEK
jgi:hypothetical protein